MKNFLIKECFLVLWQAIDKSFINYKPQFESNSLPNRKPMQILKQMGHTFLFCTGVRVMYMAG